VLVMVRFTEVIGLILVETLVSGDDRAIADKRCTMFVITSLGRPSRSAITAHLLALQGHDRQERFMGAVTDAYIERYVAGMDGHQDVLLGAFDGPQLCGLVHGGFYAGDAGRCSVDLGVSVATAARGQGLGRRLCLAAMGVAQQRQAVRAVLFYRAGNPCMAALALNLVRSCGGELDVSGAERTAVLPLGPGDARTALFTPAPPRQRSAPQQAAAIVTRGN
jgi:ribosomal protein S18 acetylase RimI-like enzyme